MIGKWPEKVRLWDGALVSRSRASHSMFSTVGPKDDLESLGFSILDFIKDVPWRKEEYRTMLASKMEFLKDKNSITRFLHV